MPYVPRGVAQPTELMKSLVHLGALFPPEVVNWNYTLENDWSGDPAIFFWITISDEAANRKNLSSVSHRVNRIIDEHLDPLHEWGLFPYVSFRSHAEQQRLQESVFG